MSVPIYILIKITIIIYCKNNSPYLLNFLFKSLLPDLYLLCHNKCHASRNHKYYEKSKTNEHHNRNQSLIIQNHTFPCNQRKK